MAFTYQYTGVGTPSSILRSDGVEFPQLAGNREYDQWVIFTNNGGTTDDAPEVTLETRVTRGKLLAASLAADSARPLTDATHFDDLYKALRFQEAQRWADQDFDSPADDAEAPLLAAEVDAVNTTVDAVATAVLAELATLKAALADIGEKYVVAIAAIDDAADQDEIDEAIVDFQEALADTP